MDWAAIWTGATALLTLGLLVATGVYAWLTHCLVKAGEEQSWQIARPRMLVAIRTNQGGQFLIIHIENIGSSAAEDLRLEIDRPLFQQFGSLDDIAQVPIFREGLRALPSRTPIRIGLGVAHQYLNKSANREKHPSSFTITAHYRSGDRELTETFPIDVSRQFDATLVDRDYAEDFYRTFPDQLGKHIKGLATAMKEGRGGR